MANKKNNKNRSTRPKGGRALAYARIYKTTNKQKVTPKQKDNSYLDTHNTVNSITLNIEDSDASPIIGNDGSIPCTSRNLELFDTNESITSKQLEGRRIVDIRHIFNQIQNCKHKGGFGCSFMDMKFENEIMKGFSSVFYFRCKMCDIVDQITSESPEKLYMPINKALVNATLAIGIGYSQLTELSAIIDVPSMVDATYQKLLSNMGDLVHDTAWDEIKRAGDEERKIALEEGNTDEDGIPMCTVIADGQWSKRSYKTKYNALSGAATIIGYKTGKILFIGIRNSYCAVCQRASARKEDKPDHRCFLNWNKPSTGMEADGILEGFLNSYQMHGLKYNKLIGDGDSSVTKRLNERLPYGSNFHIQKIECSNHLLRNYSQKMTALGKKTEYPILLRKHILSHILRFRTDVTKAVHYRKFSNKPKEDQISDAEKCGMMREIKYIISRLVNNASSLIEDVTNNLCEQFNSVINKHIGGKRINFSQGRNFETRIEAAVIAYNSKKYLRTIHKKMLMTSPGKIGKKYLKNISRVRTNTAMRRRRLVYEGTKRKKLHFGAPDKEYGLAEPLLETLSEEQLNEKKLDFINKLSLVNNIDIEKKTREQNQNFEWFQQRKIRLTASKFGEVCKMKPYTSCKKKVHSMLYKLPAKSKEMDHGIEFELHARTQFENMFNLKVTLCGLIIDSEFPYLAASPGIV
ncbi:uncharacterized protein LOC111030767 isoform X3 [Myzus persicae]|uniref:uncharacterized protein LOC111030767 isoform X3 n=1 Tax=Myzus persicae TaxID=13164 RepID=UPI000B931F45|nr:uncharacterized protein LOC111030767 isoform X3 [Myzus persicae]